MRRPWRRWRRRRRRRWEVVVEGEGSCSQQEGEDGGAAGGTTAPAAASAWLGPGDYDARQQSSRTTSGRCSGSGGGGRSQGSFPRLPSSAEGSARRPAEAGAAARSKIAVAEELRRLSDCLLLLPIGRRVSIETREGKAAWRSTPASGIRLAPFLSAL
jgi:hypothetical protein